MKGRKGRVGLKGQLVDKSVDAYILALETINRLSTKYRVESFSHLVCNAWELLLKARLLDTLKSRESIYYKKGGGEVRRTLSLRDALAKIIPNNKDPIRRNLEKVVQLRDDATHFVIIEVPSDILLLFQACVINYHKKLNEWFSVSLGDRVTVGMMTIVYDVSPSALDLSSAVIQRRLGKDAARYLSAFQSSLKKEFDELGKSSEYSIGLEYKLVLSKKPGEADIVLNAGEAGHTGMIVQVAKDPGTTHPFRQKELVLAVNDALGGAALINQFDIQCMDKAHAVKKRAEWYYKGRVAGSASQYSEAFKNWLVDRFAQDQEFFRKARTSASKKK